MSARAARIVGPMRALHVTRPLAEWTDPRHRRGVAGEIIAARYLESRGFTVVDHRFRVGHHDVDLVARRGALVVFVEVKARTSVAYGPAVLSIGWRKQRDLAHVASCWIARHGQPAWRYRFDVVSVSWEAGRSGHPLVEHLEGAFASVEK